MPVLTGARATSRTPVFDSSTAASRIITASRISRDRVRKIRFFQPAAYVSIDYAAQKVEVWRLRQGRRAGAGPSRAATVEVANEEPLKRELADFVEAVCHSGARRWSPASRAAARSRSRTQITDRDGLSGYTATTKSRRSRSGIPMVGPSCSSRLRGSFFGSPYAPDLNDFLADLDRRRLLARVGEPVSPELEIAAVTDRACKSPGGGPALLFERPAGFDIPVATNVFGSIERMCLALGVKTLDDLAARDQRADDAADAAGHHGRAEDAADRSAG